MILAEKITEERKKNGWSQEELADRLSVSRQAISKWESAGSVPDLQRIIQMADLFGVSTDYLLKDEITAEEAPAVLNEASVSATPLHRVSLQEANDFLESKKKEAPKIANATSLCILSPVLFIILGSMAEEKVHGVSEALAAIIGCVFLFGLIGIAVYMFITAGIRAGKHEYLEKNCFETEYGVTGMAREKRNSFEPAFARGLALGVLLCIVAVVPLIVVGAMGAPDYICGLFTGIMLAIIAFGVNMIIRVAIIKSSYDALLQEGDFTKEEKKMSVKLDAVTGTYWLVVVAIYLGWSFWTQRWDFTWIVWPVAGVLSAVVKRIAKLFADK